MAKTLWDLVWLNFPYLVYPGQLPVDMFFMFSYLEEGSSFTGGGKFFSFQPSTTYVGKVENEPPHGSYCSCRSGIWEEESS